MKEEKKVVHEGEDENDKDKKIYYDISMEENIGNHGYIGYIGDISTDILEKNIGRLKIVKNSWKCKKNLIII